MAVGNLASTYVQDPYPTTVWPLKATDRNAWKRKWAEIALYKNTWDYREDTKATLINLWFDKDTATYFTQQFVPKIFKDPNNSMDVILSYNDVLLRFNKSWTTFTLEDTHSNELIYKSLEAGNMFGWSTRPFESFTTAYDSIRYVVRNQVDEILQ